MSAVDSTFILGNVTELFLDSEYHFYSMYDLYINNHKISVHEDGGFIAFLPIKPGWFDFIIEVKFRRNSRNRDLERTVYKFIRTVQVPEPLKPISFDTLVIEKEINRLSGFSNLKTSDMLKVTFKGTPGCVASFSIPGIADSIPMPETQPRPQPYWGEVVFGTGQVPDSLLIDGIYTGFYFIKYDDRADSINLIYHLRYPQPGEIEFDNSNDSLSQSEVFSQHQQGILSDTTVEKRSSYKISINPDEYPFTVRLTDSVQTVRFGPRKGYFSIFQPEGVEMLAVGSEGDWYICDLSKTQTAYVFKETSEKLAPGLLPPLSYLSVIRTKSYDEATVVEIPLSGKHPFRIIEEDKRTIKIQLFGVISNTDWIRYDFSGDLIDYAYWSQPEEQLYEVTIKLTKDIWGYDSYYKGNTFHFQINKPPENIKKLKGKRIVIDPGHSSDVGAVGPTGYTEAEANLGLALELRKQLERKGAVVIMTRDDTSHVALYDRPAIAKAAKADLFLSIHNNALPDGVNPFVNHGSSTYYYHLHSIDLAKAIQSELPDALELGDYGLYYGNLAVNRPTQYPAVLIETAFMIIPEQEALLKTDKFRKKAAKAIVKGVENFFKEYANDNWTK